MNGYLANLAQKYSVEIYYRNLKAVEIQPANMFTRRVIGFGGVITAAPMLYPNWEWVNEWRKSGKILPWWAVDRRMGKRIWSSKFATSEKLRAHSYPGIKRGYSSTSTCAGEEKSIIVNLLKAWQGLGEEEIENIPYDSFFWSPKTPPVYPFYLFHPGPSSPRHRNHLAVFPLRTELRSGYFRFKKRERIFSD